MATNFHGTHCAGTIGAVGNNGIGVSGVNWKVRIMPLNAYNVTAGGFYVSAQIMAYLYAQKMGARITSHSYGGYFYYQARYDAINSTNFIMVCSAGNEGNDNDIHPAYPVSYQSPNIISVASVDNNNIQSFF